VESLEKPNDSGQLTGRKTGAMLIMETDRCTMKTQHCFRVFVVMTVALSLSSLGSAALAETQNFTGSPSSVPPPPPPAPGAAVSRQPDGVAEILQLAHAKVSDNVMIAYIRQSRSNYNLDANQIISLRQQGVSDAVINAMLNQPKPSDTALMSAPPQSTVSQASVAPSDTYGSSVTVAPSTTYVAAAPATYYYYPAYSYSYPAYYPYYGYAYPPVSFSFGWGWGGGGRGWGGRGWRR
jgi:hypothetical protein